MLMKMSKYKSVTTFIVSIFIANILLALLVAYACDDLKEARNKARDAYHNAQEALSDYESTMLGDLVVDVLLGGAVGGVSARLYGATALSALAKASGIGAGSILIISGYNTYRTVTRLQAKVEEKAAAYAHARGAYDACLNPPQRYTYTDYYGNVYEFSDKDSYNDFLRNRGHSTI